MTNLSNQTRKEQVHAYLKARLNAWVDGPELANEHVGGSEGLKRLRELRAELALKGEWEIEMRGHPEPGRDIYQYRLTAVTLKPYAGPTPAVSHASVEPAQTPERPPVRPNATARRSDTHLAYDPVTQTYMAVYDGPPPIDEDRDPEVPGQIDLGVEVAEMHKYAEKPKGLELGRSILCPMCHGVHRAIKEVDPLTGKPAKRGRILGYEELTRNPKKPSQTCPRCNGFGLIPAS